MSMVMGFQDTQAPSGRSPKRLAARPSARPLGLPAPLRPGFWRQRFREPLPSPGLCRARGRLRAGDAHAVRPLHQHPATRWFIDVHSYVPAIYHTWGFDEY